LKICFSLAPLLCQISACFVSKFAFYFFKVSFSGGEIS